MKYFLLLTIAAAVAIGQTAAEISDPKLKEIFTNCRTETKVGAEEWQAYWNNPSDPDLATTAAKCAVKCFMEKTGMLQDGQLSVEGLTEIYGKSPRHKLTLEELKHTFDACKSEKGEDECDTTHKLQICLSKAGLSKL